MGDRRCGSTVIPSTPKPSDPGSTLDGRMDWQPEEDDALLTAIGRHGTQWKQIALEMPNRNHAMCRNRYARIKAAPDTSVDAKGRNRNRCTKCGQINKGHTCRMEMDVVQFHKQARDTTSSNDDEDSSPPSWRLEDVFEIIEMVCDEDLLSQDLQDLEAWYDLCGPVKVQKVQ